MSNAGSGLALRCVSFEAHPVWVYIYRQIGLLMGSLMKWLTDSTASPVKLSETTAPPGAPVAPVVVVVYATPVAAMVPEVVETIIYVFPDQPPAKGPLQVREVVLPVHVQSQDPKAALVRGSTQDT